MNNYKNNYFKLFFLSLLFPFMFVVSAHANNKPQKLVSVVKADYQIHQGKFSNSSAKQVFHRDFLVKKAFTSNNQKYYWLVSLKKHSEIGYINKRATATENQTKLLKVPYISQYKPVFAPWGCAATSMAMLLGSRGKHVDLKYAQNHLPMQPTPGGQKGNVYTGAGFGYVIKPGALANYAKKWSKNVYNISSAKLSVNNIKKYVQGGQPVLFYGFSSYQKPGDYVRNHCKVITGYKNHQFRVNDPLYYSKHAKAGAGGKNMKYDRGAIAWEPLSAFSKEYNRKAITIK
ncbi:C39 family peptidase [Apilactobacillus xinyiensis]|uniref:C39 family peptidase n=1 Tax=Apilactobacillus xinyiensis TaxID=2841032 RepID=UPI002034DFB6|nr:C39 family peptidase [Apilactobacillus xinyiensis]